MQLTVSPCLSLFQFTEKFSCASVIPACLMLTVIKSAAFHSSDLAVRSVCSWATVVGPLQNTCLRANVRASVCVCAIVWINEYTCMYVNGCVWVCLEAHASVRVNVCSCTYVHMCVRVECPSVSVRAGEKACRGVFAHASGYARLCMRVQMSICICVCSYECTFAGLFNAWVIFVRANDRNEWTK